jgi:hypothetical protein
VQRKVSIKKKPSQWTASFFVAKVDIEGKISNHLKTYLSDFWEFYQTSPALQKALENA